MSDWANGPGIRQRAHGPATPRLAGAWRSHQVPRRLNGLLARLVRPFAPNVAVDHHYAWDVFQFLAEALKNSGHLAATAANRRTMLSCSW